MKRKLTSFAACILLVSPSYADNFRPPDGVFVAQPASEINCPALELVQTRANVTALKYDGYTVGHMRNFHLYSSSEFGPAKISLVSSTSTSGCADQKVEIRGDQLFLSGRVIGTMSGFNPTAEVERIINRGPNGYTAELGGRIRLKWEDVAARRDGPDVPMPDAPGGGGAGDGIGPGGININDVLGGGVPKCCKTLPNARTTLSIKTY
jgi:hypothetical protein